MNALNDRWKTEILMTEMNDEITSFCWSKDEQYLLWYEFILSLLHRKTKSVGLPENLVSAPTD
jgi:hypothetical protein